MYEQAADDQQWEWRVFDRSHRAEADAMDDLIQTGQVRLLRNTLDQQLEDLVRSRSHGALTSSELMSRVDDVVGGMSVYDYGRWIYYPWSGSLVHLLPPTEFRELRLDRNRHKITTREQERLRGYTVAVVGLSAGNVIARTLCLEGVSERFKLADFDVLTVSNLNRLEAGVHELGVKKTVLLARRLGEINPYASVSLWSEGLTRANVDGFLSHAPRPDVLVEECDDIQMKLLVRERARDLGIPVLMETSDRGMLDVERFDLEPNRPVLHGLVGNIAADALKDLSEEQRLALVLSIVGADSISTRAAVSLLEMNKTISTWPQLASDVVLGGAIATAAIRRLALGRGLTSGRRFVDTEAILEGEPISDRASTSPDSQTEAVADSPANEAHDLEPDASWRSFVRFVVQQGSLAPSGGNCQPWKFYAEEPRLWVVHDRQRSKNLMDWQYRFSHLALGAAIENICVASAHRGHSVNIDLFPRAGNDSIVAQLVFSPGSPNHVAADAARFDALGRRVTNRKRGHGRGLEPQTLAALTKSVTGLDVQVQFVVDRGTLVEIGRIAGECDRTRFLCPALHDELISEIRWTVDDACRTRTGIALDTLELSTAQTAVLRLLARPDVAGVLRDLDAGGRLAELSAEAIASSDAVGLISVDTDSPSDAIRAGRAFERLWLDATALELGLQPLAAPNAMFRMLETGAAAVFSDSEQARLRVLRDAMSECFPEMRTGTGLMLLRLSKVPPPSSRSLRLRVDDVLFNGLPPEEPDHAA